MIKTADEEEKEILCAKCGKDITGNDGDNSQYTCEECDEIFCEDCCVEFENLRAIICKGCIDEVYPREEEVVEKVVERTVEFPKETIKVMRFSEPIL